MGRTDTASRVFAAAPDHVYAALVDAAALTVWLPPDGMSGRFECADPRQHPGMTGEIDLAAPDELRAFCGERMAAFKTPAGWYLVSTLPATPTGKIQKFALRDRIESAELQPNPARRRDRIRELSMSIIRRGSRQPPPAPPRRARPHRPSWLRGSTREVTIECGVHHRRSSV